MKNWLRVACMALVCLSVVFVGCDDDDDDVVQSVTGTLVAGDFQFTDGEYYDVYHLEGAAGNVTVSLASPDFDTYLMVGTETGATAEDDDSGAGLNSMLAFPAQGNTTYIVVVTSFDAGETGQYTLTVDSGSLSVRSTPLG